MRLLNTSDLRLGEFADNPIPPYAILSHRWEEEEVTLQELESINSRQLSKLMDSSRVKEKKGYKKIKHAAALARKDRYSYIWIDTCCIDKTSSAELSEAINSMYRWYKNSAVCYVYLSDVLPESSQNPNDEYSVFRASRWFTRGWTLQELIAPKHVQFLAANWSKLGWRNSENRRSSGKQGDCIGPGLLAEITGIDESVLNRSLSPLEISIASRMSWAASRETTRTEDMAYCLLGIFAVNMPLLYGEGRRAFIRLQEAVMRENDDQSIFAWELPDPSRDKEAAAGNTPGELSGLLAQSPACFALMGDIRPLPPPVVGESFPASMSSQGLSVQLYLRPAHRPEMLPGSGSVFDALLDCSLSDRDGVEKCPSIALRHLWGNQFARVVPHRVFTDQSPPGLRPPLPNEGYRVLYVRQSPTYLLPPIKVVSVAAEESETRDYFKVAEVEPHERWDARAAMLKPRRTAESTLGTFRFTDPKGELGDIVVYVGLDTTVEQEPRPWFEAHLFDALEDKGWKGTTLLQWMEGKVAARQYGQELGLPNLEMDQDLPCQVLLNVVTTHARKYIVLQVVKRTELDCVAEDLDETLAPTTLDSRFEFEALLRLPISEASFYFAGPFPQEYPEDPTAFVRVHRRESPNWALIASRHADVAILQPSNVDIWHGKEAAIVNLLTACRRKSVSDATRIISAYGETIVDSGNDSFYGFRPIHWAAFRGDVEMLRVLVRHGASTTSLAYDGLTPLHVAAFMANTEVAREILADCTTLDSRKAMLLAQTTIMKEIPLHLAASSEECTVELLELLSSPYMDPTPFASRDWLNPFVVERNMVGETAIFKAAATRNFPAFKWLLEQTVNLAGQNAPTNHSRTLTWYCTAADFDEGIELLQSRNRHTPDGCGISPVHLACRLGFARTLSRLLQEGNYDVSPGPKQNPLGLGPVHIAALFDNYGCLEPLRQSGHDMFAAARNFGDMTPLHLAALCSQFNVAVELLRHATEADILMRGRYTFRLRQVDAARVIVEDWAEHVLEGKRADLMANLNGHYHIGRYISRCLGELSPGSVNKGERKAFAWEEEEMSNAATSEQGTALQEPILSSEEADKPKPDKPEGLAPPVSAT